MGNEKLFILSYSATLTNHVDSNSAVADSPSAMNREGDLYKQVDLDTLWPRISLLMHTFKA